VQGAGAEVVVDQETSLPSAQNMIDSLKSLRDRARLQMHLFSLEAQKHWREIETSLQGLETRLEQGGKIADAVGTTFREVTDTARQFFREIDGTLELSAPVRTIMRPAPSSCSPDDTLNRAAQIMWDRNVGVVPVVDETGRLVGILTDRDICMAAYTRGLPTQAMSVASAMATNVYPCSPEDSIGHVASVMAERQIRRVPVLEAGRLAGIVSLGDIARFVATRDRGKSSACLALTLTLAAVSAERPREPGSAAAE
jgi:CBS domain-containing protein